MSAVVATGGPVAAPQAAPPAPADAGAPSEAAEAVVGPSADDGDPEALRLKAREVLFGDGEPTEEAPKPVAKPKVEEKPKDEIELSKSWAKLTAQETRLKERQKTTAETIKKLEEREAAVAEREAAHGDPLAYLEKQGWTKDKIVEWIQSDGKIDPELMVKQLDDRYKTEIQKLREERETERRELENSRRERQMAETEAELGRVTLDLARTDPELGDLKRLIEKNPKKFEAHFKERVGAIIREVWKKTFDPATGKGTVVDPRDALVYLQQELAEYQLSPGQAPAARTANPGAVEPSPITNQASSQRTVRAPVDYDELDPEARRARSEAYLRGEIEE